MINTRKIKDLFKYNKLTGGLYSTALTIRDNRRYHNKFDYHGTYIDRKQRKNIYVLFWLDIKNSYIRIFLGELKNI